MTDRELLEMAAKAAGIEFEPYNENPNRPFFGLWLKINGEPYHGQRRRFNALTDDGDCARLESKLMLDVRWWPDDVTVGPVSEMYVDHEFDKQKARRYATVRAAAAIGSKHDAARKEST